MPEPEVQNQSEYIEQPNAKTKKEIDELTTAGKDPETARKINETMYAKWIEIISSTPGGKERIKKAEESMKKIEAEANYLILNNINEIKVHLFGVDPVDVVLEVGKSGNTDIERTKQVIKALKEPGITINGSGSKSIQDLQILMGKTLGIRLNPDGKFGKDTFGAMKRYLSGESGEPAKTNIPKNVTAETDTAVSSPDFEEVKNLLNETDKIKKLTQESAKYLVNNISGYNILYLPKLESIDAATAKELANFKGHGIDLGLKSIDATTARELAKFQCSELSLQLESIDADTAGELAKFQCSELFLPRLKSIDATTAGELSNFQGNELFLGLENLDNTTARELANFKGNKLSLFLKSVDVATARELANFQGNSLDLPQLESIDATIARELANFQGNELFLRNLESIDSDTARELASFQGSYINLDGLKNLDTDTAKELANFKGGIYIHDDKISEILQVAKEKSLYTQTVDKVDNQSAEKKTSSYTDLLNELKDIGNKEIVYKPNENTIFNFTEKGCRLETSGKVINFNKRGSGLGYYTADIGDKKGDAYMYMRDKFIYIYRVSLRPIKKLYYPSGAEFEGKCDERGILEEGIMTNSDGTTFEGSFIFNEKTQTVKQGEPHKVNIENLGRFWD